MGEGNGGETCLSSAVYLACFCSFDASREFEGEELTLFPDQVQELFPHFGRKLSSWMKRTQIRSSSKASLLNRIAC